MIVPHFVDEHAVDAHGKDFNTQLLKFGVFFGDRRNFGGSDKGKITRVKTKYRPFSQVIGQFDIDELSLLVSRRNKVGCFFSYVNHLLHLLVDHRLASFVFASSAGSPTGPPVGRAHPTSASSAMAASFCWGRR
jgi:hypothetical protein